MKPSEEIEICIADEIDRQAIYALRHEVYASELRQHPENAEGLLRDKLDHFNIYIVARSAKGVLGFISITPPGGDSYSIDKYISRPECPFAFDARLYEIRLLTVINPCRGTKLALLLMYAAFRYIVAQGGTRIVAIGRQEVLELYKKVGMQGLGRRFLSGAVTYELMTGQIGVMTTVARDYEPLLKAMENTVYWNIGVPFASNAACYHGGAFFKAIGEEFDCLERRQEVINADVLDAWFPPSPKMIQSLKEHFDWTVRTSPPVDAQGVVNVISRVRKIPMDCVLTGGGSSDLIYLAFQKWLNPSSRVLITDPSYGEYAHVLENVVQCHVDRIELSPENGYRLELSELEEHLEKKYDMIVLVNPANPTGQYVPKSDLEALLRKVPSKTLVWIDEAYLEYVGSGQSLEPYAARAHNVIICKSMSKVYALSGLRAAYLCASAFLVNDLKRYSPPWAMSLPAQIAAVYALQDPEYYASRYEETRELRDQLVKDLACFEDWRVIPGVANFVVCSLPAQGPTAEDIVLECRRQHLFIRDLKTMGRSIGGYTLRIAVKDADTNHKMMVILQRVYAELYQTPKHEELLWNS